MKRRLLPVLGLLTVFSGACVAQFQLEPGMPPLPKDDVVVSWFMDALKCIDSQNWVCAIDTFKKIVVRSPRYWVAYSNLSNACFAAKRYEEARMWADRGLTVFPKDITSLSAKANALHALGKFSEARSAIQEALAIKDQPWLRMTAGLIEAADWNYRASLDGFSAALADDRPGMALDWLAETQWALGDVEKSLESLRVAERKLTAGRYARNAEFVRARTAQLREYVKSDRVPLAKVCNCVFDERLRKKANTAAFLRALHMVKGVALALERYREAFLARGQLIDLFPAVYYHATTLELQRIAAGRSEAPISKLHLMVAFFEAYEKNRRAWDSGRAPEPQWLDHFRIVSENESLAKPGTGVSDEILRTTDLPGIVLKVLGSAVRAHVDFDLPRSLRSVIQELPVLRTSIELTEKDFLASDEIFGLAQEKATADIGAGLKVSPFWLRFGSATDRNLSWLLGVQQNINRTVIAKRHAAWALAKSNAPLPTLVPQPMDGAYRGLLQARGREACEKFRPMTMLYDNVSNVLSRREYVSWLEEKGTDGTVDIDPCGNVIDPKKLTPIRQVVRSALTGPVPYPGESLGESGGGGFGIAADRVLTAFSYFQEMYQQRYIQEMQESRKGCDLRRSARIVGAYMVAIQPLGFSQSDGQRFLELLRASGLKDVIVPGKLPNIAGGPEQFEKDLLHMDRDLKRLDETIVDWTRKDKQRPGSMGYDLKRIIEYKETYAATRQKADEVLKYLKASKSLDAALARVNRAQQAFEWSYNITTFFALALTSGANYDTEMLGFARQTVDDFRQHALRLGYSQTDSDQGAQELLDFFRKLGEENARKRNNP